MDAIVFDDFTWRLDSEEVFQKVRMDPADEEAQTLHRLIETAWQMGRPKTVFRECFIEGRTDDTVVVDGVTFRSRVLRVNLEHAQQVFAYVATCGTELENWARSLDDMLEQYWADRIMELALRQALHHLNEQISQLVPHSKTSVMNPGSLHAWPISEQKPLFGLIGPGTGRIGVTLTESLLMTPAKSVSGIRFATEVRFESCQLCPRKDCPNRRVPYDRELYQTKYAKVS